MNTNHYVRDGVILASSPGPILDLIEQDFQTRFSRDFFRLPSAEKEDFNVYEEVVTGTRLEDDFNEATDSGPSWNGSAVVRVLGSQARSLDGIKDRLKERIEEKSDQVETGGAMLGADRINTDGKTQAQIHAAVTKKDRAPGRVFKVKTAGKKFLSLNAAQIDTLYDAVSDHVAATYDREEELFAAVDAATTVSALRAIDIEDGWPG